MTVARTRLRGEASGGARSGLLVQDPGPRDQIAELGAARAAEGGRQLRDVGPAGADVHAETAGDRVVHVPFDEELRYGTLNTADPLGGWVVTDLSEQGDARLHSCSKTFTR